MAIKQAQASQKPSGFTVKLIQLYVETLVKWSYYKFGAQDAFSINHKVATIIENDRVDWPFFSVQRTNVASVRNNSKCSNMRQFSEGFLLLHSVVNVPICGQI